MKTKTTITSFEDACAVVGLDPQKIIPDVSMFPAKHQAALIATAKMYVITEAINEDWQPDWNDGDEEKWFPWWDMEVDKNNPSGFRFNAAYFGRTGTISAGGSRLCFKTREKAEYAAKTFIDLYRDMMVIAK